MHRLASHSARDCALPVGFDALGKKDGGITPYLARCLAIRSAGCPALEAQRLLDDTSEASVVTPDAGLSRTEEKGWHTMQRVAGIWLLAMVPWIVVMSLPVRADTVPGAGIIGSPHDFTKVPGMMVPSGGAANACAFCHFDDGIGKPSPSIMSLLFSWSQRLSTQSFFWSNVTESGTQLPTNLTTWAGSSKICLGCHGDVAPTTDTYQVASVAGGGAYAGGSGPVPLWARGAKAANRAGTGRFAGVVAKLDDRRRRIAIGGDLNGTHPVGIPYPYGGVPGTYNGIVTGRHVELRGYVSAPQSVKLFTTAGDKVVHGAQVGATGMECASCHDVHNDEVRDRWLLRDTQRQLCLDCHGM